MTWLGGGLMVYSGTWGIGQSGSHWSSTLCSDAFILLIVNELLNFFLSCKELVHRQKKGWKEEEEEAAAAAVWGMFANIPGHLFSFYTFPGGNAKHIFQERIYSPLTIDIIFSAILQLHNPPRFFYWNLPSWTLHHWAVPGQANNHFLFSQTVGINLNSPKIYQCAGHGAMHT